MRARNLKSSLFDNEILGTADPLITILFEGLWCIADREGRLEDRPERIRAKVFPYRHTVPVNEFLDWLQDKKFIVRYEVDGEKYIYVLNFIKHQTPHHKEVKSKIPPFKSNVKPSMDQACPKHDSSMDQACPKHDSSMDVKSDAFPPDILTPDILNPESSAQTKHEKKPSVNIGYHTEKLPAANRIVDHYLGEVSNAHGTRNGAIEAVVAVFDDHPTRTEADLIRAADTYKAKCEATGKERTYRMSATRFFTEAWFEYVDVRAPPQTETALDRARKTQERIAKQAGAVNV